jgi:hypothetical protein
VTVVVTVSTTSSGGSGAAAGVASVARAARFGLALAFGAELTVSTTAALELLCPCNLSQDFFKNASAGKFVNEGPPFFIHVAWWWHTEHVT